MLIQPKRLLHRSYHRSAGLMHRLGRLFTPAGWLVFIDLLASGALGLDTHQATAYQGFAVLAGALTIAALWQLPRPLRLQIHRELPRYGSVGASLRYRVRIQNASGKPGRGLSLLEDTGDPRPSFEQFLHTPEPAEERRNAFDRAFGYYRWAWLVERNQRARTSETVLPDLPPRSVTEVTLELLPIRRGPLRFERAAIGRRDGFGLSRRWTTVPSPQSVLILPKRYSIPRQALPGTPEHQPGGVTLASSVGESEEFVSLREYRRGDPLRRIHWRSSARTGQLMVKEFQDEFFVRHAIILDTFPSDPSPEVFEEAVSVAASFACAIENQDSLVDLLFMGSRAYCFTAGRGVGRTDELLETLAAVEPSAGRSFTDLEHVVLNHLPRVSGGICVLLAWDQARQDLVKKMKAAGTPLQVWVIVAAGRASSIDPGPMRDQPDGFRVLEAGRVAEGLHR